MGLVHDLIWLYAWVIIFAALLSWFPQRAGGGLAATQRVLARLSEPLLRPIRAIMPRPNVGGVGVDLSPLIAVILLTILNEVI